LAAIVASLRRFGQQKPIVVDCSGVVRAGNGTLEAAKQLGWETIECVETPLKGSEATAYAIADNRTAELAEWDDAILAATLNGLVVDDAELLQAVGFDEAELMKILSEDEEDTRFEKLDVKPLPEMAWALIGCDLSKFSDVSKALEEIMQVNPEAIVETTIQ
jgi:ParB-like chromosome segregation protein Spo0J